MFGCLSCNRSWRCKLGRHCCFSILFCFPSSRIWRHGRILFWSSRQKSTWSSAGSAHAPKKKYMNFAYIFIGNIRLFFGRTVSSSDVSSTHIKYWENPIFLSHFRVFFFASTFWRNSYVLNFYIHTAHIFIRYFRLFLSANCSYPRTHPITDISLYSLTKATPHLPLPSHPL